MSDWHFPPGARALGWPIEPPPDVPLVAVTPKPGWLCDACGCGDSQGCDESVAESEPGRQETPCAVCGCRWCGPAVLA